MKRIMALLFIPTLALACKPGYMDSDTPGVCVEKPADETSKWVSEEKPPTDKMPSWQRDGIVVYDSTDTRKRDQDADDARAKADAQGKQAARIKP